jgi:hypothetical protein
MTFALAWSDPHSVARWFPESRARCPCQREGSEMRTGKMPVVREHKSRAGRTCHGQERRDSSASASAN